MVGCKLYLIIFGSYLVIFGSYLVPMSYSGQVWFVAIGYQGSYFVLDAFGLLAIKDHMWSYLVLDKFGLLAFASWVIFWSETGLLAILGHIWAIGPR
jgi:uncharacterized membrane protein